ncbi:hypothetical protein GH733_009876 [Mirounga leonina]|nr:hypothetical protein GH733_009876 [Mirounga leonina]
MWKTRKSSLGFGTILRNDPTTSLPGMRGHSFLPVIPNTQRSQLEDRLNKQERTIAFLLDQAFRIKDDISACLQGTHGFQKEELLARKLLENHIQTITSIVKKLSQNIENSDSGTRQAAPKLFPI